MFEYDGPRYRMVMDRLKEQMETGQLRPGDQMPTVRAIAATWKIGHATATKVLSELCREGYAHVSGRATYVRDRGQAEVTIREPLVVARGRRVYSGPPGRPGWTTVTESGVVVPPDYVCDVMQVDRGTPALRQQWVKRWRPLADETVPLRVIELAVAWFPAQYAVTEPDLLNTGVDEGTSPRVLPGMVGLLEAELGRTPARDMDSLHVRRADEREARLLEVEVGDPVQARVTTWADEQGVTQYREQVHPMGVVVSFEHRDQFDQDAD